MADESIIEQDLFERDIILEEIKRTLLFATTDIIQFRSRSSDLAAQQRKFSKIQSKIEKALLKLKTFNRDEQLKIRNDFNDCYYAILVHVNKLKESDQECRRMSRVIPQSNLSENNHSKILSNLPLPTFNGNATDWPTYYDLYCGQIHNNSAYTPAEKFRYLLLTLKDEPYNLIKSIPIRDENYTIALDILISRYENRRIIASNHLDRILDLEPFTKENHFSIRNMVNIYTENIKALDMMRFPVQEWNFILLNIMLRKIPQSLRRRFELSLAKPSEIPNIDVFIKFLQQEISAFEIMSSQEKSLVAAGSSNNHNFTNQISKQNKSSNNFQSVPRRSFAVSTTHSQEFSNENQPYCTSIKNHNNICICCNIAQHSLSKCPVFLNKSPKDRYNFVKSKNICFNCLSLGHNVKQCKSNYACRSCNSKSHHSYLHFDNNMQSNVVSLPPTENRIVAVAPADSVTMQHAHVNHAMNDNNCTASNASSPRSSCAMTVMLCTALVDVCVADAKFTVRCLIDTGSQASFMTAACAHRLGLARRHINVPVFGIGESQPIQPKGIVSCNITPRNQSTPIISVNALILSKIVSQTPCVPVPVQTWPHIVNLDLADPTFNARNPQPVELLLGADVLSQVFLGQIIKGPPDSPVAINSIFGFLLMGKVSYFVPSPLQVCHSSFFEDIDLQRFWELETIPDVRNLTPDEQLCEEIYQTTYARDKDGRYVVSLPFKRNAPILGQSRDIALARFRKLEFRLEKDPLLKLEYQACLQEYLDLNHMEQCSPPLDNKQHYYIPYFAVIKPSSETTKTRVVFDAGCKTTNNHSLNDILLPGPKLQSDIVDILLNFRIHLVVFTSDIKQMYRNILIKEEDREYQRIVWRSSPDQPIRDYQLRTVTFGVSSSPYLALRTIRQLALDEASRFPQASKILLQQTFVDDISGGADSIEHALSLQQELIGICKTGGFELRKWHSNSPEVLDAVRPPDSHGERVPECISFSSLENDKQIKVLGLQWDPKSDVFTFSVQISNLNNCTKRSILSEIAKIYDPLGLLSPVTLFAKHLMQLLWIAGTKWDEPPPIDIVNSWHSFVRELPLLTEISFPRHVFLSSASYELHGFSDASEKAYAACVFIRCIQENETVKVYLVLAKTRVAPLKKLSIPRLELMAALLLSKLISKTLLAYGDKIVIDNVFAWTDSSIVLAWLRSSPHEWKTFVSNRTSEILSRVPASCWRHVRSQDNPSDAASRGMLVSSFLNHSLWFEGPAWLQLDQSLWPESTGIVSTCEEKRNLSLSVNTSISKPSEDVDSIINRFSSLGKLIRVVSIIFRFYNKCKKEPSSFPSFITVPEYNFSLNRIICLVQHNVFFDDINNISKGNRPSNKLKRLTPFLDKSNYLRVGGRLHNSHISFESKHQLILPKKHHLTTLIIEDAHVAHMHVGAQTTQYLLLQKYWILSARDIIRQHIHRCIRCFRSRPTHTQPSMASLPGVRTQSARPFLKIAVDFCGPFYVRANKVRNAKIVKSYVAVFVCMSVKAIHLELVSDLSTEAFLAALRRFTSRRGLCTDIYSDNGRNFVGCNNYLKELYTFLHSDSIQKDLNNKLLNQNITWHFHPPTGSHFSGLVEAGVKSFKSHLYRVIGARTQTYDEMHTLLCQIEAVLNSRPLCVLSADPMDPTPLTPSHFLIGIPLTAIPDVSLVDSNPDRLTRWRWIQQSIQHFWKRWSREYLHEMQQTNKWFHERGAPIREGMIVVVCDDNLPPLQWKLARVHALHPGSDKITRVVTVQIGNHFAKRPVVKLCPLPIT